MQTIQCSEHYTDKGHYAVMTRTIVLSYAQLTRIADELCRNAEDLVYSTNPPTPKNRRIAGDMVAWAFNLVLPHIRAKFDY